MSTRDPLGAVPDTGLLQGRLAFLDSLEPEEPKKLLLQRPDEPLQKVRRHVERRWHGMPCRRSRTGYIRWKESHRIEKRYPPQRPKRVPPYQQLQRHAVLCIDL